MSVQIIDHEPTCYSQAVKHEHWRQDMAQKLDALAKNNTWQLVSPPPRAHVVGCKWIFKIKRNADGTIYLYKARLVAKGYKQEQGLNYFDTYSSVIKLTTIRVILTISLSKDRSLRQLDINNAFLHGELT
jgi:Reverse transcriptase (RNA-dependent DNA polymerase)